MFLSTDELGQWAPVCNRFGPEYVKAYHSYIHISPPEEDYKGRIDLYKLWEGGLMVILHLRLLLTSV